MGIYIKRMKKPNNCGSCHFNESNTHCFITKGKIDRDDYTCEIECPIIKVKTPHGKLIDADKELAELRVMKVEGETFTTAVNFAIITLEEMSAVIESEQEYIQERRNCHD